MGTKDSTDLDTIMLADLSNHEVEDNADVNIDLEPKEDCKKSKFSTRFLTILRYCFISCSIKLKKLICDNLRHNYGVALFLFFELIIPFIDVGSDVDQFYSYLRYNNCWYINLALKLNLHFTAF